MGNCCVKLITATLQMVVRSGRCSTADYIQWLGLLSPPNPALRWKHPVNPSQNIMNAEWSHLFHSLWRTGELARQHWMDTGWQLDGQIKFRWVCKTTTSSQLDTNEVHPAKHRLNRQTRRCWDKYYTSFSDFIANFSPNMLSELQPGVHCSVAKVCSLKWTYNVEMHKHRAVDQLSMHPSNHSNLQFTPSFHLEDIYLEHVERMT